MPNIGIPELLIVLAVAILILGPRRIPAAIRSVGGGLRGFKEEIGSGKRRGSGGTLFEQGAPAKPVRNKDLTFLPTWFR